MIIYVIWNLHVACDIEVMVTIRPHRGRPYTSQYYQVAS